MDKEQKPKIIVIVGPTASGKTGLAIELAKRFDGEVVSADSRQVYRGLDLGTGKVTPEEAQGIPHHLIDVCDVDKVYTAADFKHDASKAIADIKTRGKLPIIAGGTFFYIDVLLGRITAPTVPPDPELRDYLEELDINTLSKRLEVLDPERALTIDKDNKRRLVRALEIVEALGTVPKTQTEESPYDVLTIGIDVSLPELTEKIKRRLEERFAKGMLEEVAGLVARGVPHSRLESLGLEYRYISRHLRSELSYDDMVVELATKSRQYAKRQKTWLKRYNTIHWYKPSDTDAIGQAVSDFLRS